jgi:hypothetical protein
MLLTCDCPVYMPTPPNETIELRAQQLDRTHYKPNPPAPGCDRRSAGLFCEQKYLG